MPIGDGMLNPFGTVHAGALLWFADVVATVLAIGDSGRPRRRGLPARRYSQCSSSFGNFVVRDPDRRSAAGPACAGIVVGPK